MRQEHFLQLAALIPNVSHETFADLCSYEALLRKWQPHINLVADSALDNLWQRHILDSAQIFPLQKKAQNWLDLGSGGGFPAIILACLLKQRNMSANVSCETFSKQCNDSQHNEQQPAKIILVESNGKKAAFLRQVIRSLSLPAVVCQQRIEQALLSLPAPDIVTARALASLDRLLAFIAPLSDKAAAEQGITAILPKGRGFEQEIAQARQHYHFDVVIKPSQTDSNAVLLLIRNIARRPKQGR